MPVTEESIQRSPTEIAAKGIANSASANAQMAVLCSQRVRSAPRRQAIGNRISVASTMRPHATMNGETSCTASLMKKYGSPQMIPRAANAHHPRHVTGLLLQLSRSCYRKRCPTASRGVSSFLRLQRKALGGGTAYLG